MKVDLSSMSLSDLAVMKEVLQGLAVTANDNQFGAPNEEIRQYSKLLWDMLNDKIFQIRLELSSRTLSIMNASTEEKEILITQNYEN